MARNHVLDIILGLKDRTSGGLKTIGGNLKSFGAGVKKAFNSAPVRAFRRAVLGLSAAFVGAIVEAAKFNVQIARTWTMAGGGITTFRELREQARGLASDFGIARSEIASGMYNALSAGIDKANLEGFMTQAARVAVADGSDISTAVDGITTVLNAFKMEADKTEDVADKLFKTVSMGKTTFGELSRSLATVAPIAAASNIPLEQILAHVASLTASGTPTAQAMTQIRASIMGLNRALGDGWSDTMTYQEGLKAVWAQAEESQTTLLKMVGSTEAVQAVLGGVGINAEGAAEKLEGMADAAGSAQAAFEKVNQFRHWPTLLETARGTLSKFGEYVDERLAPYVTRVTEQIREWRDDTDVWTGLARFLDMADAKIREITDLINSPADLVTLGMTIAERFTNYVIAKANVIGEALAESIINALPGGKNMREIGGATTGLMDSAFDMITMGKWSQATKGEASSTVAIDESSQKTLAEAFAANLAAKGQETAGSATQLADLLAAGLTGEQLDNAIQGMELTAEELNQLIEHIDTAGQSANTTAEAAKKSADSATKASESVRESTEKVTTAMDRAKDYSLASTRAAERNTQITEQALQAMNILASNQARQEQFLNDLAGQVAMLQV